MRVKNLALSLCRISTRRTITVICNLQLNKMEQGGKINGKDLIALGYKPSRQFREALEHINQSKLSGDAITLILADLTSSSTSCSLDPVLSAKSRLPLSISTGVREPLVAIFSESHLLLCYQKDYHMPYK